MKKRLVVFCLLAFAHSWHMKGDGEAFMAFKTTKYELGSIDAAKDSVITVKCLFTNTGNSPLTVTNVKTSCDCTASKWSRTAVKAGGEGMELSGEVKPAE